MTIRLVKTSDTAFKPLLKKIVGRRGSREDGVERQVAEIVSAVQKQGDRALLRYTRLFDRLRLTAASLEVKPVEIERAVGRVAPTVLASRRLSAKRIPAFPRRRLQKSRQYLDPLGMLLDESI